LARKGIVHFLHSETGEGRHWLTATTIPPLQLQPVAPNHCRIGSAFLRALAERLAQCDPVPAAFDLDGVVVDLELKPGREDDDEDADPGSFLTPRPPQDWRGSYDDWMTAIADRLGYEPPVADAAGTGYERALGDAAKELAARLPALRARFLAGMDGLNLGLKFGLPTRKGGKEFVWLQPTEWSDPSTVRGVLQSQPHDCKGYKLGQVMDVPTRDLADYAVGSETAGLVESGPTQRVAEDYGLIL
jgi:hypothetical protein